MVGWTGPARRTWTTAALIFRWWEIAFCATDFQVLSHNGFLHYYYHTMWYGMVMVP